MTSFWIAELLNNIVTYHEIVAPSIKAKVWQTLSAKNEKLTTILAKKIGLDYVLSRVEVVEILELACGSLQALRIMESDNDLAEPSL